MTADQQGTALAAGTVPRQRPATTVELTGIASLAVRDLLNGPRREGRILATLRGTVFAEFPGAVYEPRVLALCGPDAIRLPNAIIAMDTPPPATTSVAEIIFAAANPRPLRGRQRQPPVCAGGGRLRIGGLTISARRWWDPSPVVGPLSRTRLDRGATALSKIIAEPASGGPNGTPSAASSTAARPTLATHPDVKALAACCASGDLAGAVEHAEALVASARA